MVSLGETPSELKSETTATGSVAASMDPKTKPKEIAELGWKSWISYIMEFTYVVLVQRRGTCDACMRITDRH